MLITAPLLTLRLGLVTGWPSTVTAPDKINFVIFVRENAAFSGASLKRALSRRLGGSAPIRNSIQVYNMQDPTKTEESVPHLLFLRFLVTVLTLTMIVGIIVIITLFITRFNKQELPIPEKLNLPSDSKPVAFTQTKSWFGVVDDNDQLFIFNLNGNLIQKIHINVPEITMEQ